MLTIALAAVAAIGWGAADFLGGKATSQSRAAPVVLLSQLIGLPVLLVWLVSTAAEAPRLADLAWGAAGGACGLIGVVLLYRTLATDAMTVVAPATAVMVALVPLGAGLLLEVTPGPLALGGVCCAVFSIALVNRVAGDARGALALKTLGISLVAGSGLGLQLVFLAQPGPDATLWPLVGARLFSIICAAIVLWRAPYRPRFPTIPWGLVVMAGILDTGAFAFYLFAMNNGLLSIVGPIVSLYPAATIALALVVDRERVGPYQTAGLCLAASALVLVAV